MQSNKKKNDCVAFESSHIDEFLWEDNQRIDKIIIMILVSRLMEYFRTPKTLLELKARDSLSFDSLR